MPIRLTPILFACLLSAGELSAAESGKSISVVTYNIRYATERDGADAWKNRAETVAKVIAEHDLAGLQEVTYRQLQELQAKLTGFKAYSIGREDGETAGEHTSIFFRDDRFELLDEGTFWLSETPKVAGSKSWDAAIMRICSWVKLRDKETTTEFLFANTHFDHRGRQARAESGKLIRNRLLEQADALPLMLTGDFNCLPESDPYREITADGEGPLRDARRVTKSPPSGPESTWCGFRKIAPGRIIDHIFVAGDVEVESLTVLNPKTEKGRFASDHLPVQAVVAIR